MRCVTIFSLISDIKLIFSLTRGWKPVFPWLENFFRFLPEFDLFPDWWAPCWLWHALLAMKFMSLEKTIQNDCAVYRGMDPELKAFSHQDRQEDTVWMNSSTLQLIYVSIVCADGSFWDFFHQLIAIHYHEKRWHRHSCKNGNMPINGEFLHLDAVCTHGESTHTAFQMNAPFSNIYLHLLCITL